MTPRAPHPKSKVTTYFFRVLKIADKSWRSIKKEVKIFGFYILILFIQYLKRFQHLIHPLTVALG